MMQIDNVEDEIAQQETYDKAMSEAEEIFMSQYPEIFNYVDLYAYTMGDCLLNPVIPYGSGNFEDEVIYSNHKHYEDYEALIKVFLQIYEKVCNQHKNQAKNEKEIESMSKYDISARVNPLNDQSGKVKAMASITIDNVVAINDLTVVEGKNGNLFVGYPQSKDSEGNYRDIVQFLKDEDGKMTKASLEFKEAVNKQLVDMFKNGERATPDKAENEKVPVMHDVNAYVTPLRDSENATKGLATVQVGDLFKIGSVRVNENTKEDSENFGKNFVSMPSRPDSRSEGGYKDVVHPVNKEFGEKMKGAVLAQYDNQLQWQKHKDNKAKTDPQLEKPATNKSAHDIG